MSNPKITSVTFDGNLHIYTIESNGRKIDVTDREGDGKIGKKDTISGGTIGKNTVENLIKEFKSKLPNDLKALEKKYRKKGVNSRFFWKKNGFTVSDNNRDGKVDDVTFKTKDSKIQVNIMANVDDRCVMSKFKLGKEDYTDGKLIGKKRLVFSSNKINNNPFFVLTTSAPVGPCHKGTKRIGILDVQRKGVEEYLNLLDGIF